MDDNLAGSLRRARSAFEGLILELGDSGLTSAVRSLADQVTVFFRESTRDIEGFIRKLEEFGFYLGSILAGKIIPALITGFKTLAVAMLRNPLFLLATAAIAAIGPLIRLRDQMTITATSSTNVASVAEGAWEELKTVIESFEPLMANFRTWMKDALATVGLDEVINDFQDAILFMGAFIDAAVGLTMALGLGDSIIIVLRAPLLILGEVLFNLINGVLGGIRKAVNFVMSLFTALGDTIQEFGAIFKVYFNELDAALNALASGQVDLADKIFVQAANLANKRLKNLPNFYTEAFGRRRAKQAQAEAEDVLDNVFKGSYQETLDALSDAFTNGLSFDSATQFVLNSLERAQAIQAEKEAQDRLNKSREEAAKAAEDMGQAAGNVPTKPMTDELIRTRTAAEGLRDGLRNALGSVTDIGGAMENLIVNGITGMEDALVSLAVDGKVNFQALVDGMIADIARLLARKAIFELISAFTGGKGIDIAGATGSDDTFNFGGKRAAGGPVSGGKSYLVGEEGPELFTPSGMGRITNATATNAMMQGGAEQQPVNVSVVNIQDPDDAVAALSTPKGEQTILNVISRNRSAIKQSLS
jgi:hypothetical protein